MRDDSPPRTPESLPATPVSDSSIVRSDDPPAGFAKVSSDDDLPNAIEGMLRALVSTLGIAPPSSWFSGAAAGIALVARHVYPTTPQPTPVISRADVAAGLYDDEIEVVLEALGDAHTITTRHAERCGSKFLPELAQLVELQKKLIELYGAALATRNQSAPTIESAVREFAEAH